MKKERWGSVAGGIALFGCAILLSPAEVTTVLTKRVQDGTLVKVLHETSPVTLPPVEAQTWTNADGSVSRMFPRLHGRNGFDVVTYHNGHAETNGIAGRPPGPFCRDVFYLVEEAGGLARTNRALELSETNEVSRGPRIVDVLYEPPVAVYLYEPHARGGPYDQPGLFVVVLSPSPTNGSVTKVTRTLLLEASLGAYCRTKSEKMTGSYSKGTLAVEVTLNRLGYLVTKTNRFIGGKWLLTESEPVPVDKAEKGESGRP